MHDEIPAKVSKATGILNYHVNTVELQGYILYDLEAILNGFGKSVIKFGLQAPLQHLLEDLKNKLLMEEKKLQMGFADVRGYSFSPKVESRSGKTYDLIINATATNPQEVLFFYGHSGTGKTFLSETIISSLRSQGKIVLVVASPCIASLLFPPGHTSHSKLKLPLELTDESLCHAKKEKSSRLLRDMMNAPTILFEGKTMVLGELIDSIYDEATLKTPTAGGLQEKEIVCLNDDTADAVNAKILSSIEGHSKTYLSIDEAILISKETSETKMLYPIEYLNTITFPGFSPHEL
nr:DNA helicase [Tanacetum cinerariifolium]